ncbi:MAG: hypothetical protein K0S38_1067 [Candidatus Paceibacter sp.]|jgi:hypothetical protein|nr:hypothetical protein [Candidatus Paceibacter sp.]
MHRISFLMVFLCAGLPAYVSLADEASDFLLLRNKGKLVLLHKNKQHRLEFCGRPPIFNWEGHSSKATFSNKSGNVEIEFKLDIIGPDWLYIVLKETKDGLLAHVRRANTMETNRSVLLDTTLYPNYEAFVSNPKVRDMTLDVMLQELMKYYGQNPYLPDICQLRHFVFGVDIPTNPLKDALCQILIMHMDNEDWAIREAVSLTLEKFKLIERALFLAENMSLTPEQRARIERLRTRLEFVVPYTLFYPLAQMTLNQEELACVID